MSPLLYIAMSHWFTVQACNRLPVALLSIDVEKILIHIFVEIYGGDKIFQNIYFNSFLSFEPHDLCGHKVIKNLSFLK